MKNLFRFFHTPFTQALDITTQAFLSKEKHCLSRKKIFFFNHIYVHTTREK